MDGGLAAGDNGEFGLGLGDFGCEGFRGEALYVLGDVVGVPCACGVAPGAVYGAAEGTDEIGGSAGMCAFTLEGVELFVDWKCHILRWSGRWRCFLNLR